MTKRTRFFLMGSVAFLTIGLVAGLVAYFGGIPGALAQAGPSELRFVPKDAVVVAYADVQQLMHSQFRQHVKEFEPGESKGQDEFEDATGINIERDIDYVLACLLPSAPPAAAGMDKSGYVIAKGRFDRGRIESFIVSHGGRVQNYGGRKLYLAPEHDKATDQGEHRHAIRRRARVHRHRGGGVREPGRREAGIDMQTRGAEAVKENTELYKMIQERGRRQRLGGGPVRRPHAERDVPRGAGQPDPADYLVLGRGHVNGGVSGTLSVEAKDDAAAENLRQVVQGFMALAKLQAGSSAKQAEMAAMVNSIRSRAPAAPWRCPSRCRRRRWRCSSRRNRRGLDGRR